MTWSKNRPRDPRDFETLRALIVERRDVLPKRLAQVAVYALDNPDEIAFGTAASVAQRRRAALDAGALLAQAFGYQGFSELQEVFRSRLRERVPSYDERLAHMRQHGIPTANRALCSTASSRPRSAPSPSCARRSSRRRWSAPSTCWPPPTRST